MSLKLKSGFLGYKAYYESDTGYLVFQCNNPPASMSSARIVIDPGIAIRIQVRLVSVRITMSMR